MNESEQKSSAKRLGEHDENALSKRQRLTSPPTEEPPQPTKIIDLIDDCLEKIFELLDFEDLLNVAAANKFLRPAANAVYNRKFDTKKVSLQTFFFRSPSNPYNSIEDYLLISDLKTCLKFLRCFGSSITHLKIVYGGSRTQYNHIHQYISQYCAESLITIQFYNKPSFPIENFVKPLANVQSVEMVGFDLIKEFPSFADIFPNATNLVVNGFGSNNCTIDTPPIRLEHLTMKLNWDFNRQNNLMKKLIQSNRQLQSLTINVPSQNLITMTFLLDMIKHNQLISKLIVNGGDEYSMPFVETLEVERFVQEHSSMVELDLQNYKFTSNGVMTIVRQFNFLKEFKFCVNHFFVFKHIKSQLNGEWQSNCNNCGSFVTLNRLN